MAKPQWYMTMKPLAEAAIEAVRSGQIKIRPEGAEKQYFRFMEGIHDWCLSRQLWWGHRIPMYYAAVEGEAEDRADIKRWFSGRTDEEAQDKARKALGDKKYTLSREEDVLDTWFSSGLWP
jgi:valyl-tRNA synthetase